MTLGLVHLQITWYFTEFNATAAGQRVMDLKINGQTNASGVDVYALAGAQNTAVAIAVPDFYSGTRTDDDVVLPTVVRSLPMLPCGSLGEAKALQY